MGKPSCPVCGELLELDEVGRVVLDYVPSAPATMRGYLEHQGVHALIWECFGCGEFWCPAGS